MGPSLTVADTSALLEVVEDFGRATDRDDLMRRSLGHLYELIPSVACSFNWFASGRGPALVYPELAPGEYDRYAPLMDQHWTQNPLMKHIWRTADARALTWKDLTDDEGWRAKELYQEYYRPRGVTSQVALRLPSPPGVAASLTCSRDGQFSQRDRDMLSLLGRSLGVQMAAAGERSAMRAAFDQRGWRTVLVDDDARVVEPRDAEELSVTEGTIVPPALAQLVSAQFRSESGDGVVSGKATSVKLATRHSTAFLVPSSLPPHVLLFRSSGAGYDDRDAATLRRRGLSARETDVAALLAQGSTNKQIAKALGIGVGTVKKHVQRVFAVLEVETRAAAAAEVVRHLR